MAKKKKQRGAVPIETVTIDELDAQIKAAVAGRAHLAAIRSCLKDGLLNRPTQMEYAFAEPTIELPELPAG
jgi:hypothetical protein